MNFKIAPLAVAVAAVLAAPAVLASGQNEGGNGYGQHHRGGYHESTSVEVKNKVSVETSKKDESSRHISIVGGLLVGGIANIDSSSTSLIDDKQINTNNAVTNTHNVNNANVGDSALNGAGGNIGVNSAAGDNNMQDNAAALSSADASFVFGSSDATAVAYQKGANNATLNDGNVNNANMSGSALSGAAGNIGVNITAGDSNLQKNNFSGAVATARVANANVTTIQRSGGNETTNQGRIDQLNDTTQVTLNGGMTGFYGGHTSGSYQGQTGGHYYGGSYGGYSGNASGDTSGTSDQRGNVYLDIWNAGSNGSVTHPTDTGAIGHVDVDNQAQGAQDPNGNGGAFTFDNSGTYSGTESGRTWSKEHGGYSGGESGSYSGKEVGGQALWGSFSGEVVTTRYVVTPSENNANLSGNALRGASGNIGVNVSAGTGNMQNNSLAISATQAGMSIPGGGGTGGEQ
ncbi:MAG: hypothetical protein P8Y64_07520 [Gammaproteobacteria bacterium]|jgi:hypothetical protein